MFLVSWFVVFKRCLSDLTNGISNPQMEIAQRKTRYARTVNALKLHESYVLVLLQSY